MPSDLPGLRDGWELSSEPPRMRAAVKPGEPKTPEKEVAALEVGASTLNAPT